MRSEQQQKECETFKKALFVAFNQWRSLCTKENAKLTKPHAKPFQVLQTGEDFARVRMASPIDGRLRDYTVSMTDGKVNLTYIQTVLSNQWSLDEFTEIFSA